MRSSSLVITAALVACGPATSGQPQPDAAAVDATEESFATQLTLTRFSGPVAHVPVIFHDADGAVLAEVETNNAGQAHTSHEGVAHVTVLELGPNNRIERLLTYVDINAGAQIELYFQPNLLVGELSVQLPGEYPGASSYSVIGPCFGRSASSAAGPFTGNNFATCLDADASNNILAVALDGNTPLAYGWVNSQSYIAPALEVATWSTDIDTLTLAIDEVPDSSLVLSPMLVTRNATTTLLATGNQLEHSVPYAAGFADQASGWFSYQPDDNTSTVQIIRTDATGDVTITAQAQDFVAPPTVTVSGEGVEWTGPTVDGHVVTQWSPGGGGSWSFMTYGSRRFVVRPQLPERWHDALIDHTWAEAIVYAVERDDVTSSEFSETFYSRVQFNPEGFLPMTGHARVRYATARN